MKVEQKHLPHGGSKVPSSHLVSHSTSWETGMAPSSPRPPRRSIRERRKRAPLVRGEVDHCNASSLTPQKIYFQNRISSLWTLGIWARGREGRSVCLCRLFCISLDVAAHAAQRRQFWRLPMGESNDPQSQATFSSLGESCPARCSFIKIGMKLWFFTEKFHQKQFSSNTTCITMSIRKSLCHLKPIFIRNPAILAQALHSRPVLFARRGVLHCRWFGRVNMSQRRHSARLVLQRTCGEFACGTGLNPGGWRHRQFDLRCSNVRSLWRVQFPATWCKSHVVTVPLIKNEIIMTSIKFAHSAVQTCPMQWALL